MARVIIDNIVFFENHPSGNEQVISEIDFVIESDNKSKRIKDLKVSLEYDANNFVEYSELNDEIFTQWIENIWGDNLDHFKIKTENLSITLPE